LIYRIPQIKYIVSYLMYQQAVLYISIIESNYNSRGIKLNSSSPR
jgi:hypothetical protein